jgi:hypothetical protein
MGRVEPEGLITSDVGADLQVRMEKYVGADLSGPPKEIGTCRG